MPWRSYAVCQEIEFNLDANITIIRCLTNFFKTNNSNENEITHTHTHYDQCESICTWVELRNQNDESTEIDKVCMNAKLRTLNFDGTNKKNVAKTII